jgi:hypothetical protein
MGEEKKGAPHEPAPRQPTFVDALAELAKALGGGGRGVDRGRGGPQASKVTRAPRRSCCSGKR